MQLFYCTEIDSDRIILDEEESRHCFSVLRYKAGDELSVTDGLGNLYHSKIKSISKNSCEAEIMEAIKDTEKRSFHLHLAVAPPKNNERLEWFLEKATEIGIDEITPIICEHSERRILKTERLKKILITAMKQSGRVYLPKLNESVTFKNFIGRKFSANKFLGYHDAEHSLKKSCPQGEDVLVLIGPEGDFSTEEIKLARASGYKEVSMGTFRLRTETAALVACHTINLLNQD